MDKTLVNAFKYVVTLSHPNPPQQIIHTGIGRLGSARAIYPFRLHEHVQNAKRGNRLQESGAKVRQLFHIKKIFRNYFTKWVKKYIFLEMSAFNIFQSIG